MKHKYDIRSDDGIAINPTPNQKSASLYFTASVANRVTNPVPWVMNSMVAMGFTILKFNS